MNVHYAEFRPVIHGHGPKSVERYRERIEELEEENRQLRDRIAQLTGINEVDEARKVFGFTESEARIFVMLFHRGKARYADLQEIVEGTWRHHEADMPVEAIRTHIKRMRRKMAPYSVDFETIYAFGYEFAEEMRLRARSLIRCSQASLPEKQPEPAHQYERQG